ncbi:MAG: type III-B CRISPR-associated protein Cas10/Cmr2 [Candidatus Odinarchaeota archaeon]|nr:type III-B CRISPR-associated protein Cas10/Cmr2 [Candidatus Odinarchaeota archaeon]
MSAFWRDKIKAFLHDPPDKALYLVRSDEDKLGHEDRRDKILQVLNLKYDIPSEFDYVSSSLQRISVKTVDEAWIDFTRTEREKRPYFIHTISAVTKNYKEINDTIVGVYKSKLKLLLKDVIDSELTAISKIKKLAEEYSQSENQYYKQLYLYIWRFFKDFLFDELKKKGMSQELAAELVNLPADTRTPDHIIWDHMDIASAVYGALKEKYPILLLFKISPVQSFIRAARKEKDLWAGSHLLSFLTFKAMKVIIDKYGPDSIIYPHLRGLPFMDISYFSHATKQIGYYKKIIKEIQIASIPNRFLALIGVQSPETINGIEEEIKENVIAFLRELGEFTFKQFIQLIPENYKKDENYYLKKYLPVIENYFSITVAVLPFPSLSTSNYEEIKQYVLSMDIPKTLKDKYIEWIEVLSKISEYPARYLDLYGLIFEILTAVLAAKSIKLSKGRQESGFKCTVCGELVAIYGEENYSAFSSFWRDIASKSKELGRFKLNEKLCPICLVKRYYADLLEKQVVRDKELKVGFESVAKMALSKKADKIGKIYYIAFEQSSKFDDFFEIFRDLMISVSKENFDNVIPLLESARMEDERSRNHEWYYIEKYDISRFMSDLNITKPLSKDIKKKLDKIKEIIREIHSEITSDSDQPKYYAILVIDGDNMGKMLVGDSSEIKNYTSYLHHQIANRLPDNVRKDIKRKLTPSIHMAISRALMHFSTKIVPTIVEDKYNGELIYSGGDDILALLPMDTAIKCAYEIQKEFNKNYDNWDLLPAKTMSGGILIVHYLHPLQDALERARYLEEKAKKSGRNAFFIGFLKRSGAFKIAGASWDILGEGSLSEIVKYLKSDKSPRISKRMIYDVLQTAEALKNLNEIEAYLKYELSRHLLYDKDKKKKKVENLATEIVKLIKYIRDEKDQCQGEEDSEVCARKLKSLFTLFEILVDSDSDLEA